MMRESSVYFLCLLVLLTCVQFIHTSPIDSHKRIGDDSEQTIYGNDWLSSEQTIRCHGMPCPEWDAAQAELANIRGLARETRDTDTLDPGIWRELGGDGDAVDGDEWLTLDQLPNLKKNFQNRFKRKLTTFGPNHARWDDMPIRYYIDSKFNDSQANAIRGATHHWEAQTCITFIEITYEQALDTIKNSTQFLYFVKRQNCGTFVGRIPTATGQQIRLGDKCIEQWGAVVHEIGHILGFWHEHQRSDRNRYVTIIPEHMIPHADMGQYDMGNTRNFVRYDYGSVMHYWAWTHSTSYDRITIAPHDMRYLFTIGQKIELSFLDARLANIEYCSDRCSNAITCQHEGYQDPNNCYKCKCPDGLAGDHCDRLQPSVNADCGGQIVLLDEPGKSSTSITSPGYLSNTFYKDHTSCTWHIQAPENYQVNLVFTNTQSDHFGMYCKYPVCFHWVEIKMKPDMSVTGPRFCCRYINKDLVLPGILTSDNNQMMVLMRSNFTTPDKDEAFRSGFRAFVYLSKQNSTGTGDDGEDTTTTTTEIQEPPQITTAAPSISGRTHQLDIIFVMDSSGSVGKENWTKLKDFTKDVIYRLLINYHDYQFAFITYGSTAHTDIHLGQHTNYQEISDVIGSLPWVMGASNIADGLRKARLELLQRRSDVPNLVVLVTDGPASAEQPNTGDEAMMLRNIEKTHLLVIGLTNKVNAEVANQLIRMASSPTDKYFKLLDTFNGMNNVVTHITDVAEELGNPTQTVARSSRTCLDLIFILDSSNSVSYYDWIVLSKFVQTMMAEFGQFGAYCNTKTAVISFSNEATYDVGLGCHGVNGDVLNSVMLIPHKNRWTNTASAINMARQQLSFGRSCRRVALLITNTQSNKSPGATSVQALLSRQTGIELFVLGIGRQFGIAEAYDITRSSKQIMFVEQYKLLLVSTTLDMTKKWLLKTLDVHDETINNTPNNLSQGDAKEHHHDDNDDHVLGRTNIHIILHKCFTNTLVLH